MILKLKEVRLRSGLRQKEVADILGISKYTYSHYETLYVLMPIKHLITFCNYFHVSLDYVFGFTDNVCYEKITKDIDKVKISQNLKQFRKTHRLTQEKIALILNIGKGTYADYERGRYLIATPFLYQLCAKYKISADYLLGRIDQVIYFK